MITNTAKLQSKTIKKVLTPREFVILNQKQKISDRTRVKFIPPKIGSNSLGKIVLYFDDIIKTTL